LHRHRRMRQPVHLPVPGDGRAQGPPALIEPGRRVPWQNGGPLRLGDELVHEGAWRLTNHLWIGVRFLALATLAHAGTMAAQSELSRQTPATLERSDESKRTVTLEGFVLAPDGSPAEGAVVVSSAGGRA